MQKTTGKIDLQNALKKEFTLLAYASGSENTQGNSFDFDVPLKDTGASLSDAQQNNLEYALAKDRVQQANAELKSVKVSQRPTIGVNALAGVKNGYVPNVNTQKFNYAAGVGVLVPIYDGSRQRKQIKVAELNIQQNQLALTSLDNEYRKNIQQAYTDITSNNERIQNTAGQIEEAKAAEQLATSRFQKRCWHQP